jgi:uncharacterized protein (DUF2147 family)
MKRICITLLFLFLMAFCNAQDHGIMGKWKTIDDSNGKPLSVVEIFESKGKIYGKVIEIFNQKNQKRCVNCTGEDKNKPILGLIVIKGLTKDGDDYNGKILDPKQGKLYKCIVNLESRDRLKVRGYIGISLIGRTQVWERIK